MFQLFKTVAGVAALLLATAQASCPPGEHEVSVEGALGVYCVAPPVCVGGEDSGLCPGAQAGLENGSYCGVVATGVYGCKRILGAGEAPRVSPCASGEQEMSVEGVEGVFCVAAPVCVATEYTGNCPGAQARLPNGSYCGVVASGVYGCKPNTTERAAPTEAPTPTPTPTPTSKCGAGTVEIGVADYPGTYCLSGNVCSREYPQGKCPSSADGFRGWTSCGQNVATGEYECFVP